MHIYTFSLFIHYCTNQGWGAGAGRSRVFLAPWSRSRMEKKSGAGADAAKKLAGSSALLEDYYYLTFISHI